jgi:hypothetical protein
LGRRWREVGKGMSGVACVVGKQTVVPWGGRGIFERKVRSFAKIAAFVRMSATISAGDVMRGCVG